MATVGGPTECSQFPEGQCRFLVTIESPFGHAPAAASNKRNIGLVRIDKFTNEHGHGSPEFRLHVSQQDRFLPGPETLGREPR